MTLVICILKTCIFIRNSHMSSQSGYIFLKFNQQFVRKKYSIYVPKIGTLSLSDTICVLSVVESFWTLTDVFLKMKLMRILLHAYISTYLVKCVFKIFACISSSLSTYYWAIVFLCIFDTNDLSHMYFSYSLHSKGHYVYCLV